MSRNQGARKKVLGIHFISVSVVTTFCGVGLPTCCIGALLTAVSKPASIPQSTSW